MLWLLIAVGAAVTASVCPQTREKVKDVPWMPLAVFVGLGVLSKKVGDGFGDFGTDMGQLLGLQRCWSDGPEYTAYYDIHYQTTSRKAADNFL